MTEDRRSIPQWIKQELFEAVLRELHENYKCIKNFRVFPALKPGENYASLMLKVQMEVILNEDLVETQTFMLKVAHDSELLREQLTQWDMFSKEAGMYREVVPEMEELYRSKGLQIRFGAKSFKLPTSQECILLEDLGGHGFRNAKRQDCLDMQHALKVLEKLAQWHAASAVRISHKGLYPEAYRHGIFVPSASGKQTVALLFENSFKYFIKAIKRFPDNGEYLQQMETYYSNALDIIFERCQQNLNEFKVLNHGDFWCNNIMFKYDEKGTIQDTYFVDLQMPRYGSPAQDLWLFIVSSLQLNLKMHHFDELILYYHGQLVKHLKLLEYSKPMPSLRDLQISLLDNNYWASLAVCIDLAGVLCDPCAEAKIDNVVGDSGESSVFLEMLYFNERYLDHIQKLLPWLYRKGVFDK